MVRFGVAGYPPAFHKTPYKGDRIKILDWLKDLGLDALELQMTYGPRTSPEVCRLYRKVAEEFNIALSVHGSYFIVFTSKEALKLDRSRETLKRTYELCGLLNSDVIVLHPGPLYGDDDARETTERFVENVAVALQQIGRCEIGLFVETAGKRGQLGSVDEVLDVSSRIPGVYPCIDFGHIHARTLGSLERESAIQALFAKLDAHYQKSAGSRIHFHYTPIHYGPRGEISHRAINDTYPPSAQMSLLGSNADPLRSADGLFHPRVEPIAKALKKSSFRCTIISETNDSQEEGALALKRAFLNCE